MLKFGREETAQFDKNGKTVSVTNKNYVDGKLVMPLRKTFHRRQRVETVDELVKVSRDFWYEVEVSNGKMLDPCIRREDTPATKRLNKFDIIESWTILVYEE